MAKSVVSQQYNEESPEHFTTCLGLDVYVPSFNDIMTRAGLPKDAIKEETIKIPTSLFKFLMSTWLRRHPFDANEYRKANPDVDAAIRDGSINDAREHYISNGYFEGRAPGRYPIDEHWYRTSYPDVRRAEKAGLIGDLTDHYNKTGRMEGRVGSSSQASIKGLWESALTVVEKSPKSKDTK